jgi:peroxiredoxin Q/BCP
MPGPAIGSPAPAFSLLNQHDKPITPRDFAGQWAVLYFYPKDDTPGCTIEACEFTSGLEGFEQLKAKVLGVSADSTQSHRDFIAKYNLKIDLLSDPSTQMLQAYGVWGPKESQGKQTVGITRQTFIIDPKGQIAHHWPKVTAQGHAQEVRQKLTELQGGR